MITKEKCDGNVIEIKKMEREILLFISQEIRNILMKTDYNKLKSIEEIRLRANKPLMIHDSSCDWFINNNGALINESKHAYMVTQYEITKTLELMSENSVYAFQDEIRNGFITLKGGHRVGIAGKAVLEGNNIKNLKDISGLNIRISREISGCSSKILKYIISGKNDIHNTLIISPPQCGKTTMLRDIALNISDGISEIGFKGLRVGIIDERSELASCYKGVAQNRVGVRTDVLDACPKKIGMVMMLRSMSPQVIITDEIGNEGDKEAIMKVINAGVKIITSAHGFNISELKSRREVINLIDEKVFERFIVLNNSKGPGTVSEIIDGLTMKEVEYVI